MNTAHIWTQLQQVQHELKQGTPDTQDEVMNVLQQHLETSCSALLPSFVYPPLVHVLGYYWTEILHIILLLAPCYLLLAS